MPEHWPYVLAAYLIWGVAFGLYWLYLVRKERTLRRTLARLERGAGDPARG